MVPSGEITKSILFGEDGVASRVMVGTVICDMSSVMPTESQECYRRLREKGVGSEPVRMDAGTGRAFCPVGTEERFVAPLCR